MIHDTSEGKRREGRGPMIARKERGMGGRWSMIAMKERGGGMDGRRSMIARKERGWVEGGS